jgi:hypothetical protein
VVSATVVDGDRWQGYPQPYSLWGDNPDYTAPLNTGLRWSLQDSGSNRGLTSVAYGNNLFIATGSLGNAISSDDGVTWSAMPSLGTGFKIAFGGGVFIAFASGSAFWSTDGGTWTACVGFSCTDSFTYLAYGNGTWCAAERIAGGILQTSTDGQTWTSQTRPVFMQFSAMSFGNGMFLGIGHAGARPGVSIDGITWTQRSPAFNIQTGYVAFGGGQWVAIQGEASPGQSWTSTDDGSTWDLHSRPVVDVRSLVFAGSVALSLHNAGTLRSTDGTTWETINGGLATSGPVWNSMAVSDRTIVSVSSTSGNQIRTAYPWSAP